ncbi:hypothetical protein JNB_01445 [Janibacter sp. HTCC2649]|uniref:DUF3500 domain-containing protein n=1 Tax=Janibacter sp. HTCC2649 TaxID=313589 RepID=UPI000066EC5F|nr:DUF3500 domain-containing protein [Janibacter sp. HTCC2649]EAP98791.1 hypothetical protein JNB_01445 [Janibacter sp. HTCC2649]
MTTRLTHAATDLLGALSVSARAEVSAAIEDPSWTRWSYLPGDRPGLSLEHADPEMLGHVNDLLARSHSELGVELVQGAIEVERERRRSITGETPSGDRYWLRVHGTPGGDGPWAWRLNGHHVGVHVVVDGEGFTATPHFIGSEPAHLTEGPLAGTRLLGREEDLARELLAQLSAGQREQAISSGTAPDDILSAMDPVVDPSVLPTGIRRAGLDASQRRTFDALTRRYLDRLPTAYADACWEEAIDVGADEMAFAWAGSTKVGEGHYYCVTTPVFLIEYDNTQDGANHAHSVLRHLRDDFGGDALRRHHRDGHSPAALGT